MKVLGIETSCDETAVAIVDGRQVLSNIVSSQVEIHRRFGGVVPEIASRNHVQSIVSVAEEALQHAGLTYDSMDAVGATYGPGLVGPLLVGLNFGKALAIAIEKPFVAVNHLDAHLNAVQLDADPPAYPFTALLVSGGHTHLFDVRAFGEYRVIGRTQDDAAGEAFDKVAKLLGLPYPGGVEIDRLARFGNTKAHMFPRAMPNSFDFSFSGLKTAVALEVRRRAATLASDSADIAASFQEAVVDVLVEKSVKAAAESGHERLVVAGGVAANSRLRARLAERAAGDGVRVYLPAPHLCTDNAAMVAFTAGALLERGAESALGVNAQPSLRLA